MKVKKILFLLAPLCCVSMLASCGGSSDSRLEIIFKTTMGKSNQAAVKRAIATFEEENPDVRITLSQYSGDYNALGTATVNGFTTGDYGDLVMVYPDSVANFIDYGYAVKLDSYIDNAEYGLTAEDKEDLIAGFMEEGQSYVTSGTWSMPFAKSTEVMYYNTEIIGLKVPGINNGNGITKDYLNNLTWEEFFGVLCPALYSFADTTEGAGLLDKTDTNHAIMCYDSDDNFFITLAAQYGYDYTKVESGKGVATFNNDNMKNLMYELSDYAKEHYICSAGSTNERGNDLFTTGRCLFSIGSTAGSSYQYSDNADIDVARVPYAEGHARKVISQGPSICILRKKNSEGEWDTERTLWAWKFYKHMISKENALDWSLTANYMPIRKSAYTSEDYIENYSEESLTAGTLDMLNARIANFVSIYADDYFANPAFKGSSTCRDAVSGIMTETLKTTSTKASIDAAFDTAENNAKVAIG